MAKETLNVFHSAQKIGALTYDAEGQTYSFEYEESWQKAPDAFDLAPLLSRKEKTHTGTAVRFFFSNLLPEGEMLEIVSKAQGVSKYDPFGLLRKIGAECAGALKILDAQSSPPDGKSYIAVDMKELSARARSDAPEVLADLGGRLRMSLAGVQDKLPALLDVKDGIFLPELGSASTHVLKPNNRRWKIFPHSAANEHFCMRLAQRAGLRVPKSQLLAIPERLYAVERFDRAFQRPISVRRAGPLFELEGEPVSRLHQIDVCQALGLPPTQKYEEPEYETAPGPDIVEVTNAVVEATGEALTAKKQIIDWVIFNYLIGNSDSHAKNISLLWQGRRWIVAPAYDLVSVAVYSDDPEKLHDFAFNIGADTRYGWITGLSWYEFAESIGVGYRYVQAALRRLLERVGEAGQLLTEMTGELTEDEVKLLTKVVALIERHSEYVEEAASTMPEAARAARGKAKSG